jgi:hypothetical protein
MDGKTVGAIVFEFNETAEQHITASKYRRQQRNH